MRAFSFRLSTNMCTCLSYRLSTDLFVCFFYCLCVSKIVSGDLTRFHLDSIYVDISLSWRLCVDCYLSPVVCRHTSFLASVVRVKRYLSPVFCR